MYIDDIKALLGDTAENFSDKQIDLTYKMSVAEIEEYCNRTIEETPLLVLTAYRMAVIKLNRIDTDGLENQSYSGVSESYLNDYPEDIKRILNKKRRIKVVK